MIALRPMSEETFAAYLETQIASYAAAKMGYSIVDILMRKPLDSLL